MDELIYQKSYTEFREELRSELKRTAEGFVRIGYLLRVARDTDILKTSGYSGLEDFARGEFDLDKTQVSRFIRINERFSEGGNSDKLMTGYADFGVRKLGLMLTLPDVINEELSPGYTVDEINSIKETYDEEKKVSPLEDYMEQQEAKAEEDKAAALAEVDILSAVIYQIGHESPDLFKQMYESEDLIGDTDLFSVLAPGGEATHKVRIKGVGALLITCNDKTIAVTNMRSCIKQEYGWGDANRAFNLLIDANVKVEAREAEEAWQQVYEEDFPEKEKQTSVPEKKPSKVIDHTKKEKKDADTISETAVQPERREETAGSVSERTQEEPKEEAKEEQKEEPKDEPKDEPAAVIPLNPPVIEEKDNESELQTPESIQQDPLSDFSGSKEATWANMLRAHNEARKLSNHIRDTFTYEAEELGGDDIRHTRENVKKLMVQLEILISGYDEVERDLR